MRESNELRNYGPDKNTTSFAGKWLLWIIGMVLVLGAIGWVINWASVPGEIASAENVKKQWEFAYTYEESLKSAARQVCSAERALTDAQLPDERTQRRSQVMALEQNYSRIQAEFNARLRNAFQAKLVAPSDVPETAPELSAMKSKVCQ